jgi:hypothetical protein
MPEEVLELKAVNQRATSNHSAASLVGISSENALLKAVSFSLN